MNRSGAARIYSLEAERAILGAILLGGPGTDEAIVRIRVADFFLSEHQVLLRHIKALHEQGKPTNDAVLLHESLAASDELEAAGGAGFVVQILDGLPRISNITHYIEIVEAKARLRQCAYIAEKILEMALGANGNAVDVLRRIEEVSAPFKIEVGQKRMLAFKSGADLAKDVNEQVEWIARGYVAKGAITELGAKVKAGKTTLILNLVRAAAEGLDFLGKPTRLTPTVYLTEQPVVSFRQSMRRANLLGRDDFRFLFYSDISTTPWPEVAAAAVNECKHLGAALLVIDTLPQFAGLKGDSENNSGDALAAMQPLQQAAADGIGTILVRHERKSGGDVGDSGRGSSAFAGAVDIVLSLRRHQGNAKRTIRVLQALSRFSETPAELLVEFTDDGYISLGEPHEAAVKEAEDSIIAIAPKSETEAVALKELMEGAKISRATAQRAIKELITERILNSTGNGKKGNPFRYFLAENRTCPTSDIGGRKENANDTDPEGVS
ncbi:MAG: AAA family ATPase [Candidatus Acidiferrales bacterium]